MTIDKEEVLKIARMSRIAIYDDEVDSLVKQLKDVLSYAGCVKKIAEEVANEPSSKNVNFFREDVIHSYDGQEVLERAPDREEDYFVVPKILDK